MATLTTQVSTNSTHYKNRALLEKLIKVKNQTTEENMQQMTQAIASLFAAAETLIAQTAEQFIHF